MNNEFKCHMEIDGYCFRHCNDIDNPKICTGQNCERYWYYKDGTRIQIFICDLFNKWLTYKYREYQKFKQKKQEIMDQDFNCVMNVNDICVYNDNIKCIEKDCDFYYQLKMCNKLQKFLCELMAKFMRHIYINNQK